MMFAGCLLVWLAGVFVSAGVTSRLGERNPETIGDCFTGDYTLDFLVVLIWPILWPCYVAYRLGRVIC